MSQSLSVIRSYLKKDLKIYKETLTEILSSNVFLIDNITKYIIKHKGKNLRPLLVLLSANLLGQPSAKTYQVAAIVELLHTATLIHDDVVDGANIRRSFPSINAIWKNKISVLMGDYILAKSLITATETGELEIMTILANTARRMSKGELLQIEKSRKLNITEDEYLRMISDKTAALISACCELGVLTVTHDIGHRENLRKYGEYVGIAFQIKDDLLDFEGNQIVVGKPVGTDLKEKKITLPLILSFKNAPEKEKNLIIKLIKKGVKKNDVQRIQEFIETYDGLEAARNYALDYAHKAKQEISNIPEGYAKSMAIRFVEYSINRKK
jgi:octaprenyl-diphosphate synthase